MTPTDRELGMSRPIEDAGWNVKPRPEVVGRQRFGNVAIARLRRRRGRLHARGRSTRHGGRSTNWLPSDMRS